MSEYLITLIIFSFGLAAGALYGIFKLILIIFKNNKVAFNVLDFVFVLIFGAVLFFALNYYNMGQFRFYLFAFYVFGFILERVTLGKLFAKLYVMMYNNIIKLCRLFKTSKAGKIIFK